MLYYDVYTIRFVQLKKALLCVFFGDLRENKKKFVSLRMIMFYYKKIDAK